MLNRQAILFEVMQSLSKLQRLDKLMLTKTMFLLKQQKLIPESTYSFYPFKYGPFSLKIYSDLNYFERIGWIIQEKNEIRIMNSEYIQKKLSLHAVNKIQQLNEEFPTSTKLMDYVYQKYPEYCTKSVRTPKKTKKTSTKVTGYYLIGYEGKDIDEFLNELIQNDIQCLIDVRNSPRSMKIEFNKNRLEMTLKRVNIKYYHMPELGIPKDQRKNLNDQQDYEILFREYANSLQLRKKFLDEIIGLGLTQRIGIMCFERNPQMCHRREIGKYLEQEGYQVQSL